MQYKESFSPPDKIAKLSNSLKGSRILPPSKDQQLQVLHYAAAHLKLIKINNNFPHTHLIASIFHTVQLFE